LNDLTPVKNEEEEEEEEVENGKTQAPKDCLCLVV
jgi:hypothetical protein